MQGELIREFDSDQVLMTGRV